MPINHIVIIGSGFGGCTSVRMLRKHGHRGTITLISPSPELFYYPSLIWVPAGRRTQTDLRILLSTFFNKHDVVHQAAKVTGINAAANTVRTERGEVAYDALIIASGGRYIKKLPGIEHVHIGCAGWDAIKNYSDRLSALNRGSLAFGFAGNPKEPSAMRGGPVFEYLFGVDTLLRQQGRRDQFNLTFFSPAPKPGARMGEKAVDRLLGEMNHRNIRTHLGHKMKGFEADKVITEGGEIASDLTLFIPGMTGPDFASETDLPLSEGGFFQANEHCVSPCSNNVYLAGDCGSFPGPDWKPKQAHMADLQAETAVNNIIAQSKNQPATHTFKTELICIVDSLTNGTLVYRDKKREFQFKGLPMHWAKLLFEKTYLRQYRLTTKSR